MQLKEKILEKCDEKIAVMERPDCPKSIRKQTSKQILEIICSIYK